MLSPSSDHTINTSTSLPGNKQRLIDIPGQTETRSPGPTNGVDDDFLARERAALGDEADQFAGPNDNTATVEDGDDGDLLGGGGDYSASGGNFMGDEPVTEFESSFPAIDSGNAVRIVSALGSTEESADSMY